MQGIYNYIGTGKVKVTLEQATKAQRGEGLEVQL
jgi:hypothetical protein